MTIACFIRENIQTILDEWDNFARAIPMVTPLSKAVLRDHAEGILMVIATDLESAQSAAQEELKSTGHGPADSAISQASRHGADRVLEGFSVDDTMSEYRALRASVVRLWARSQALAQEPGCAELIRFNEAIDQALTESLRGYASDKARRDRLFDTLLSASPDLSFIVDTETRLIYGNAALANAMGEPLSALRGKRFADVSGHSLEQFEEHVRLVVRSKSTTLGEISRERRGESVTYEYLLVPVTNGGGAVEAVAGIARDVTDRKAAEEKYKHGAQYDDLTGLANRHLFRDRLHHEIKRAERTHLPLAVLFVDLDGFKQVNDLLGHEAGDELLRQAAERMQVCVRGSDTVARLGGDEFAVVLADVKHMPHVNILAQHLLDTLARGFSIGARSVVISASVGIALYPDDASAAAELLRHADQAMYAAKQNGRNRYCFFTPAMRSAAWPHLQRIAELRQAVAGKQFKVLYQPIVALAGGLVVGAEAQLYWQHPEQGQLPARDFTDLVAEAGLAGVIDALVLKDVLDCADAWRQLHGSALYVSIDKSSLALGGKATEQQVKTLIEHLGKDRSPVALEVSEATLLSDAPANTVMLQQLASAGITLCLGDFGAGYASLASLTRYPLSGLRIGSALVLAGLEGQAHSLGSGIVAAGHALGLKIIAEGVETADQEARLRAMECDYAQGAHFFGALDADAVTRLFERRAD